MSRFTVAVAFLMTVTMAEAVGVGDMFGALMGRSGAMGNESTVDEALARVTSQINKNTPMAVDKETRLDKVTAEPGARLVYHYTLVRISSTDVNSVAFQNAIKPQLQSRLCSSPEMQNFLKSGVKISYLYRGSDGRPLGGVGFVPNDCGYKA